LVQRLYIIGVCAILIHSLYRKRMQEKIEYGIFDSEGRVATLSSQEEEGGD
jgi:hypothetical protein